MLVEQCFIYLLLETYYECKMFITYTIAIVDLHFGSKLYPTLVQLTLSVSFCHRFGSVVVINICHFDHLRIKLASLN
jgi:hypothetical protein